MTRWGIGPKFTCASFAALALILTIQLYVLPWLMIPLPIAVARPIGYILIGIGTITFVIAAWQVHTAFGPGRLVTTGAYAYVRNPMYASWIVLIVPGLVIVTGYAFCALVPFAMYLILRRMVRAEETYLAAKFGRSYLDYKNRVPLVFPLRWKRRV